MSYHSRHLWGGGVQENSKNSLSDNPETIPTIYSHEFIYKTDEAVSNNYTFKFTQDSTVVQMIPYGWNTLNQIVSSSGAYSGNVFNGWNVTYKVNDSTYGMYVTYSDDGTKLNYVYTAEQISTNSNIETSTKTLARIMPGDGVKFGDVAGYDLDKKVLTLPTNASDITFTAKWDTPLIVIDGGALATSYTNLGNTPYDPISGKGSIFTNIIYVAQSYRVSNESYNLSAKPATILGSGFNKLDITINNINGETYFENIGLENTKSNQISSNNYRLIVGEHVKTSTNTMNSWYSQINNNNVMSGFRLYDSPNCIILGGDYAIVAGTQIYNIDSYISVGSQYPNSNGPNIFMLYGSNIQRNSDTTINTNIIINSGNVLELMGGAQNGSTASSTIEVAGGYVSYLTGGPRSGSYTVGNGSGTTAVKINVSGGTVDYLFSGAKDGNTRSDMAQAPVKGNVEIKVSGGKIYGLFGGGYDFWSKTVGNGVIGNIDILITGGQIGKSSDDSSTNYWNAIGDSIPNKPSNYYSIEPGVYGGGYRGSVEGTVTIKIGGESIGSSPYIYGNIYGGGSGGPDLSIRANGDGAEFHNDTTGKSHIIGSTNVVIGNAAIDGNIYGGGMGVAKSSYVKITNVNTGALAIFTDLDNTSREVAKVTNGTTVQIQNNANIIGNIYGGGKGVSKSVFISPDTTDPNKAVSILYGYSDNEKMEINYEWQHCSNNLDFETIGTTSDSYSNIYQSGYLRLKVTLNNESIYSNSLSIGDNQLSLGPKFTKDMWDEWNKKLYEVAAVKNGTEVNILSGTITGNVYGGGSLAVVNSADESIDTPNAGHTKVTVSGGKITGNVYGGGEGETEMGWTGNVTVATNVTISNGTISGNVYGGGELGIVGQIDYSDTTNTAAAGNFLGFNGGTTNVTISGGIIGTSASHELNNINNETGNVYGGGKGYFTQDAEYALLGAVGKSTTVTVNNGTIHGNVFGGGELGIVGTYSVELVADPTTNEILSAQITDEILGSPSSKYDKLVFESHDGDYALSKLIINDGTINGSAYGGGKGTTANIISGAVGKSILIISNGTISGNAYGGGGLALVGSITIDLDETSGKDHQMQSSKNDSSSTLVILGGSIGNVYGGGFGPRAVINGSTYVLVGKQNADSNYPSDINDLSQSLITITGNVYGGGEMGSVGFIAFSTGDNGVPSFTSEGYTGPVDDKGNSVQLGSNIIIALNSKSITINGNVYGGGKGGDLYTVTEGELRTYYTSLADIPAADGSNYTTRFGYAIVHGDSKVDISGEVKISGSIFGGGEGIYYDNSKVSTAQELDRIIYAAVTKSSSVKVSGANITQNIYGGGEFGIIGYYKGVSNESPIREFFGGDAKVLILKATVGKDVYGSGMGTTANILSGAVGNTAVVIANYSEIKGNVYGGGSYALVSGNGLETELYDESGNVSPHMISADNDAKSVIVILGASIGTGEDSGSIYGGGFGPRAVIAGSTYVFLGSVSNAENQNILEIYNNALEGLNISQSPITITGSVYGGGDMGSVGFVSYLEGTENRSDFGTGYTPTNVSTNVFISSIDGAGAKALEKITINGGVFGGGKGGDLYILPSGETATVEPDNWSNELGRILYGYAIVHGNSLVKITGTYSSSKDGYEVSIGKDVYGGGMGIEREGTGSISDLGVIQYAAVTKSSTVEITHAHIMGNIHGGGNLGIVGYYIDSGDVNGITSSNPVTREFTGTLATVIISDSNIEGNIYGSGKGTTSNLLSGAVGNTTVIISKSIISKINDTGGNVFGGGAYSLVGSFTLTIKEVSINNNTSYNPTVTKSENKAEVVVIILGGTIDGNVFGGGYGPRAVIAGSAYVFLGSYANNSVPGLNNAITETLFDGQNKYKNQFEPSVIGIKGSVYGGGNMGSIGVLPNVFSFEGVDDYSAVNQNIDDNNKISANVFIKIDNNSAEISITNDVYGGGKGGNLYVYKNHIGETQVSDTVPVDITEYQTLRGYAVIYGTTNVEIDGEAASKVAISGNVFGGGEGFDGGLDAIQYAEVYDSANVSIQNASVGKDVYGGGNFSVIGHYSYAIKTYFDKDGKPISLVNGASNPESVKYYLYEKYFCGDDLYIDENGHNAYGPNRYKGSGSTTVYIAGSDIAGSVYGGGSGSVDNVLSGAVGRQTHVIIDSGVTVEGSVYGGGKQGIVGSITVWIVSDVEVGEMTSDNYATITVSFSHRVNDSDSNNPAFDQAIDTLSQVYILGGTIKGNVYGAGKGQELVPFIIDIEDEEYSWLSKLGSNKHITANKLSVFGRTEVNVSGGEIYKHVYGGSENGSIGSITIMKQFDSFLSEYNKRYDPVSSIKDIPAEFRDNYDKYLKDWSMLKLSGPYTYNTSFANIVGGIIHGNVFGGGYFGEIYGSTHVHIGWNSVMPYDDGSNGDCHYYNQYGDANYGDKLYPFDYGSEASTLSKLAAKLGKEINKGTLVNNLFINGSVYAGGDRGDSSATTVDYDYISVYGSSHILVNGTGYATGTNTSGETKAMYIQGSLFGSGNSCSTFYVDKDMSRFITITNYHAINDQYLIYSIQRVTNVTLINSSMRLPGRSDGSNLNKTALYSLNHVISLTLQSGSELILDSVVQDLRSIYSKDGSGANTAQNSALNTIKLNNGITLIVKTEKGSGNVTSPNPALSSEPELWPDGEFGKVTGYFFLDLSDASYYSTYVYGSQKSEGGFIYGNTFGSLSGTKIGYENFGNINETGSYRAWHPVGGGHLSASSTIVADTSEKVSNEYVNYGKIVLPMTQAGAKFKLIGYNIYPAQAASLNDDKASLRLIGENVSFGNSDVNRYFKLKASLGAGFNPDEIGTAGIWITDEKNTALPGAEFTAEGGVTLPEINLELRSNGVTQTTTAGYIVLLIQELIPDRMDAEDKQLYTPGNEISAVINIETQADGFGTYVDGSYKNNMNLYATKEGEDSWNMSISNINNDKYRFELTNVIASTGLKLVDSSNAVNSKDKYMIRMNHSINNDKSTGWDGFSFEELVLTTETKNIFLGETDGRFNTSFQFIINNLKDSSGYAMGTVTLTISYYKISTTAKASEEPVLADNTTPDGTITIIINVGEQKPWYNVKFVPAPGDPDAGVGAVATQQVTYNTAAKPPVPNPVRPDGKYLFDGWYRTYNGNDNYSDKYSFDGSPSSLITKDTILYGKWVSAVTFNYNYKEGDADYDNCPGSITIKLDSKSGTLGDDRMPSNTSRAGYDFIGWSSNSDGTTGDFISSTQVNECKTVYAVWSAKTYKIEFNGNNPPDYSPNISVPQPIENILIGSTISLTSINDLTVDDTKSYKFSGWSTSSVAATGITGDVTLTKELIDKAENDTITLYAVWVESTKHTITFSATPDSAVKYVEFEYFLGEITEDSTWTKGNAVNVDKGSTIHIKYSLKAPGDAGYTNGTYTIGDIDQTLSNGILTISDISEDKDVVLKLTPKKVTVTLDPNGGTLKTESGDSISSPIEVEFGGLYPDLNKPTWLGYEFLNWNDSLTNGKPVSNKTEVTNPNNHTLYAYWNAIDYRIVFHNGTSEYFQTFNYNGDGTTVELITNPFTSSDNKIFKGWAKTDNSDTPIYSDRQIITINNSDISVANDNVVLNLYAVWADPVLDISFMKDNKSITGETFDGYDWKERISLIGTNIIINVKENGTAVTLPDNAKYIWTKGDSSEEVSAMRDAGTYTLTISYTSNDIFYSGNATFTISPYTGDIFITGTNSFTYDGLTPLHASSSDISAYIGNDNSGYKLTVNDLLDFEYTYYLQSDLNNPINAPVVVGSYTVKLTAKNNSLNYSDSTAQASDSMDYNITPKKITITISGSVVYSNDTSSFNFPDLPNIKINATSLAGGDSITKAVIHTSSSDVGKYRISDAEKYILESSTKSSIKILNGENDRTNCYVISLSESSELSINSLITLEPVSGSGISFKYQIDSGEEMDYTKPFELSPDQTVMITAIGTKDGHHIVFSSNGVENLNYSNGVLTISGNDLTTSITVTADWAPNKYKLTINGGFTKGSVAVTEEGNSSELTKEQDQEYYLITYGKKITIKYTYSGSEGYRVTEWKLDPSSDTFNTSGNEASFTAANDVTLTLTESNKYKLTINGGFTKGSVAVTEEGNSSELTKEQDQEYYLITYGKKITIKYTYSGSEGYRVTEWKLDPSSDTFNTSGNEASFTAANDVTLTLTESNKYKLIFDSTGGSLVDAKIVTYNSKVTKPTDPTKSGYKFAGWYKDAALTNPWDFDNDVVTADIILYAKWEPTDKPTPTIYKVEYNANGGEGEVPKAELHFAGEFVTVKSADLRKNGYTFKGWCDSVTQTIYQPDEKFRMPSRDVCLAAVWESDPISGKEVSVTFIVDNEIYGISSTHINTALNGAMQADPVKEGFDFIGWYTKEGEVFTANTIVNNDMTVYAKFELNEDYVLVTYIIDNEVYMTLACKKTKIIEPNISAGMDKELNGWYTDKELKNKFDFNSVIEEDSLTLYAEWKNNSNFMILFIFALFAGFMAAVIASTKRIAFYENKDDEEKYASVIMIGKGTLKDRLPSHSNNNFEGWYSESGELITEDTEITQSMNIYAHWKH